MLRLLISASVSTCRKANVTAAANSAVATANGTSIRSRRLTAWSVRSSSPRYSRRRYRCPLQYPATSVAQPYSSVHSTPTRTCHSFSFRLHAPQTSPEAYTPAVSQTANVIPLKGDHDVGIDRPFRTADCVPFNRPPSARSGKQVQYAQAVAPRAAAAGDGVMVILPAPRTR